MRIGGYASDRRAGVYIVAFAIYVFFTDDFYCLHTLLTYCFAWTCTFIIIIMNYLNIFENNVIKRELNVKHVHNYCSTD